MSPIQLDWHWGLDAIGWLIVHSVWQFLLLGVVAWLIADVLLRKRSASSRYVVFGTALALTVACPVGTWFCLEEAAPAANVPAPAVTYESRLTDINAGVEPPPIAAAPRDAAPRERPARDDIATTPVAAPIQEVPRTQADLAAIVDEIHAWLPYIAMFWCAGVSLLALRLACGWWRVERLKRSGREVHDAALLSLLNNAIGKLQVRRSVRLLVSDLIESPVVVGALWSVILVPASFVSNVSPDHIEAILAHELAHIRRYDYLVNLLQTAIETLFFYHPAVWWLSHRMRVERENCCDDLAAAAMASPVVYSRALMALEEMRGASLAPALGAKDGVLVTRIRRLLGLPVRQNSPFASGTIVAVIGVTLGLVLVAGFSSLQAEDTPPDEIGAFVAKVDDEVSVEFVAIMPHKGTPADAWLPDGSQPGKLPKLPPAPDSPASRVFEPLGTRASDGVVLYFKYKKDALRVRPTYKMEGITVAQGPDGNGIGALLVYPMSGVEQGRVTVGIPDREFGPWRKLDKEGRLMEPVVLQPRYHDSYHGIQRVEIEEKTNRSQQVLFRLIYGEEQRDKAVKEIFAIDKSGKRHSSTGQWPRSQRPDGTLQEDITLDLPLSEIDHFEYRLRPIRHWVTFDIVSLKPGVPSEVKIEQREVLIPQPAYETVTYRGRIVMPDGSPATEKGWIYYSARGETNSLFSNAGQYRDTFNFSSPETGTIFFKHFFDAYAPAWTEKFEVGPGDVVEGLQFVVRPGFDLAVTIENEQGEPIPGAVLVALPLIHGDRNGPVHKHTADEAGQLTLSHIADTPYSFRVEAPGYEDLESEPRPVSAGKPLTLVLRKAAPTTGIVYDAEGKPAVGAKLIATVELSNGKVNFVSDHRPRSFIGETWATTDAEGRFSLNELSRDRRYLFVIEGPDESRLLYRDFRAGQSDIEIHLPQRHDLHIALRGELDEYVDPDAKNWMTISQPFSIKTDLANAGARIGAWVPIRPYTTGATVSYRGLVFDPEADWSQQKVEVTLGTKKKLERELQLSKQPVNSYSLKVGPIPEYPIEFPNAKSTRTNVKSDLPDAILFHTEDHGHWMLYHKGFLQTGLAYNQLLDEDAWLQWRFAGVFNAFSGKHTKVGNEHQWERKRTYRHEFKYLVPDLTLEFDGKEIDFNQGRVIYLDEETGDPIQLDLPLPEPEQIKDEAFMAKFEEQVDAALAKRAKEK